MGPLAKFEEHPFFWVCVCVWGGVGGRREAGSGEKKVNATKTEQTIDYTRLL